VNDARIKGRTTLRPGDRIGIGSATIEFGLGDAPSADAAVRPAAEEEVPQMLVRGEKTERIVVDRELQIGREPEMDVWLNNPAVSRRHAKVAPLENGGCIVTDHSTAGSFVNGHRFDTHELTVGDRLQIGPFCFQFDGHALNRVANTSGGSIRTSSLFVRAPGL